MQTTDIAGILVGVFTGLPSYLIAWIEYRKWSKGRSRPSMGQWLREVRRSYPFWLGILSVAVMIALFLWPHAGPEITITSPLDQTSVQQSAAVEGQANARIPGDQHLYVVVEYGGRWWPQYSEIRPGYSSTTGKLQFSTPADIGLPEDVGKSFVIRPLLVDDAVHKRFQSWFRQADWVGVPITDVNGWGKVEIGAGVTVTRR